MNRIDLADPAAGVLATLDRHQPVAVFERGGGEGQISFELETETNGRRLELDCGGLLGHWSVEALSLRGRLRGSDGSTTPIEAIGASSQGELAASRPGDDPAGSADPAQMRRNIIICLEDGGLLTVVTASGEAKGEGDREQRAAALVRADGEVIEFPEVRLSTEYGADRRQRRATLELWPAEAQDLGPLRGAGIAVANATIDLIGARSELAFFEWSVAGCPAIGRYEIIRAL